MLKKLFITLLSFFILSCSGSKVEIKPEQSKTTQKDTSIVPTAPKKIFSDKIPETTTDTIVIPKRTKTEKSPQIIVAPIVLPITTPIQIQMPEQKPEKVEVEKDKSITQIQPSKIEPTIELKPTLSYSQPTEYFVQIGAFVTENSANEQIQYFKRLHPDKNVFLFFDSTSGLYKVQINGIKDSTELKKILTKIQENFPDAFITIKIPKFKQNQKVEPELKSETSFIKLQLGAYSKISNATEIKKYVESKFNVKSDIVESFGLFKVIVFLNEGDENMLNLIKLEFPDAFIIK